MSYKTILVQGGVDPQAGARVRAALAVGGLFGAAVIGAGAEAWAPYVQPDFAFVDPVAIQATREALDDNLRAAEAAFLALGADYSEPISWRSAVTYPATFMTELARGADLVVAGRPRHGDTDNTFAHPSGLIMRAGTPVLVLPEDFTDVRAETVLVAWKDTHEARRALADSIPFLKQAKKVVLFHVHPDGKGSSPPRHHDVLERLRRHGVEAVPIFRAGADLAAGDELADAALDHHADIIVAGAYGHPRLSEWAFGGTTQTLLKDCRKPVLFSR